MADVELPRYRLKARSFMAPMPETGQRLLEAGAEITYLGMPNENLIPVNEPARKMYASAGIRTNSMRPELALPLHGPGGGEAGALLRQALGFDEMIESRFRALEDKVTALEKGPVEAKQRKESAHPTPSPAAPHRAAVPPPPPPPAKAA